MTYGKNYCEAREISTSKLNEAQRTLHYITENMKMDKSISEEGYKHFQMAIETLEQEPILDKIRAEIDIARFVDKDTKLCKNANASGLEVALQIIDKYRESEKVRYK